MSIQPEVPGQGQESVWDYPRPPRCEPCVRSIAVIVDGDRIASTTNAKRVLETSHPPVYYIPVADIQMNRLVTADGASWCEWKGRATYFALANDSSRQPIAWSYPNPTASFAAIRDHLAFYPSRVEACFVDDEQATAQAGDFYGGWITKDIVGPFKGEPGTMGW